MAPLCAAACSLRTRRPGQEYGLRVSASFQIFALSAEGNVQGGKEIVRGGNCLEGNMSAGKHTDYTRFHLKRWSGLARRTVHQTTAGQARLHALNQVT